MRSLVVFILLIPNSGTAAPPSVKFSTSIKTEKGSTGQADTTVVNDSTFKASTDVSTGSALGPTTLRMGYDRINPAYKRVNLTDRQGNTTSLSTTFQSPEQLLRAGVDLILPRIAISTDASFSVGKSAYPGYSAGLNLAHEQYATGTKYLFKLERSDLSSPISFLIEPDTFRTIQRPNRLLENQGTFSVEQVLTERLKGGIRFTYGQKPLRRPDKLSSEGLLAWALKDEVAFISSIGYATEKKSDALFDERGYQKARWFQITTRWIPSYRSKASLHLGTLYETESARGRLDKQKVGTDWLGVDVSHQFGQAELSLSSILARSNREYRSKQIGVNVTWYL